MYGLLLCVTLQLVVTAQVASTKKMGQYVLTDSRASRSLVIVMVSRQTGNLDCRGVNNNATQQADTAQHDGKEVEYTSMQYQGT